VSLSDADTVIGCAMLWQVYILSAFYMSASLLLCASVLIVLWIRTSTVVGVYLHQLCLFGPLLVDMQACMMVHFRSLNFIGIHLSQCISHFLARSQNCEKRLLASACLSVCPSAWNNSAVTGWILIKFDI
jgi:hypothetical protein